jgi:carbohydrate-selective porin OprB
MENARRFSEMVQRFALARNSAKQVNGWQATGWMNLKFDVQYVIDPGGRGYNAAGVKTDKAVVLGMRTEVHF